MRTTFAYLTLLSCAAFSFTSSLNADLPIQLCAETPTVHAPDLDGLGLTTDEKAACLKGYVDAYRAEINKPRFSTKVAEANAADAVGKTLKQIYDQTDPKDVVKRKLLQGAMAGHAAAAKAFRNPKTSTVDAIRAGVDADHAYLEKNGTVTINGKSVNVLDTKEGQYRTEVMKRTGGYTKPSSSRLSTPKAGK